MITLVDKETTKGKLESNFSVLVPHDQMNLEFKEDIINIKETERITKIKKMVNIQQTTEDKVNESATELSKSSSSDTDESEFNDFVIREGHTDAASDIFSLNESVRNSSVSIFDLMMPFKAFTNLN